MSRKISLIVVLVACGFAAHAQEAANDDDLHRSTFESATVAPTTILDYAYVGRQGAFKLEDRGGKALYFLDGEFVDTEDLTYKMHGKLDGIEGMLYRQGANGIHVFFSTQRVMHGEWPYVMQISYCDDPTQEGCFFVYQYAKRKSL